jgi:uncharacterized protein
LSRPPKQREVSVSPPSDFFKPAGIRLKELEILNITLDELEALQLAHMEGFYQVAIAKRMGVSRQTAARILESAHKKMTEALVLGKALSLEGGPIKHSPLEFELCPRCGSSQDEEESAPKREQRGCCNRRGNRGSHED